MALSVALFIVFVFYSFSNATIYDDTDGVFPWFCLVTPSAPYDLMIGGVMLLYEVTACIMSIWSFTRPLKQVVAAVENTLSARNVLDDKKVSESKKRNQKILYSGYKYKVLVITASTTTFLYIFVYIAGLTSTALVLLLFDNVVNPVCILLMTPYYPSNIYYERLCYVCVSCCDRGKASYRSQAEVSQPRASATGKSVDTSRALGDSTKSDQSPPDDVQSDVQLTVDVTPEPGNEEDVGAPKEEDNVSA
eukprot:762739_1